LTFETFLKKFFFRNSTT